MEQVKQYDIEAQIVEFLEERDIADISKRQYKHNLNKFHLYIQSKGIESCQLRNPDAVVYKKWLTEKKYTTLTIANYMITVRLFFKWLEHNNIGKDITTSIRIEKNYNTFKKKSMSVEESQRFINTFTTDNIVNARNRAIAHLMLRNGLREIEVTRINIEDITEYKNQPSIIIQRKGSKEKNIYIPLSAKAMQAIEDYLLMRTDNWNDQSPLFISLSHNSNTKRLTTSSISRMIKQHLIASGLNDPMFTAHSLRHTTAALLIEKGYSEYQVQTFMGHANFNTTQKYTRHRETDRLFINNPTIFFDNAI